MSSKRDVLDSMVRDCKACIHLYKALKPGSLDFRFSPKQRSTLELLRYLRICAVATAAAMVDGHWTRYEAFARQAQALSGDDFVPGMQAQMRELQTLFAEISDADWQNKKCKTPWGVEYPLERAMMEMPMKFLTAYKMQLFLHAKAGNPDLATKDCWGGAELV